MKNDLIKLGFSSNEADVYLALIELGDSGAGEIIKKTSLHRNIVYETLDKLVAKKLVFEFIKKNVAQFKPTDPKRILDEETSRMELAQKIVPALVNKANVKQEILIYEGLEGFRNSSFDYLEKMTPGSTLYVLGAVGDRWYELMGDALKKYEKTRLEKKIVMKEIFYGKNPMDMDKKLASNKKNLYHVRILPHEMETPANTLIFEDHIALQTLVLPYSVIQIKNANLAKTYLNYFDSLWAQGKDI